jgi:inosose dehydratase
MSENLIGQIGMGAYPWMQQYGRETPFPVNEPEAMTRTAACGFALWEGFLPATEADAATLTAAAERTGLRCVSSYTNARLHIPQWTETVENVLTQVERLQPLGLEILVVNPEPIAWGSAADKSDDELRTQAVALQTLAERLAAIGVRLAYHTHDPEMRQAAREFHHMLRATDPATVGLCLDSHWIYRGAGNSSVALEDIVGMYGERIISLHLRQSNNGVWSETFTADGDIDYGGLAERLRGFGFSGPVILEQARENGTPSTLPFDDAVRQSYAALAHLFG